MGQKVSVPSGQRVYRAARDNDVAGLQALCHEMRATAALDADARRAALNWRDDDGRTGLMLACQKNFVHVAQVLLEEGADVHAIAPGRPQGGSALAEAVAGRHEALVDLLLRYGADAFSENAAGRTPMDLALEARAVSILRACERHALFAGCVNTRVMQLKGLATVPKDRWVVVAPRFTPPPPGSSIGEVRVMLLMYRNASEADPRTKVWLDGAQLFMQGGEAILRLHPNHVQPRNVFTRYEAGWMLFFRAAHAPGMAPVGGPPPPATPEAGFAAFLATCARPLEQLQQQQQARLAAAAANPWSQAAAANILPPLEHPQPPPQQQQQHAFGAPGGGYGSSTGGGAAAAPYPSMQQQQQQQQQQLFNAGQQLQPALAPPPASSQQSAARLGGGAQLENTMVAQPGEDDEAFAQRLAAMFGSSVDISSASDPSGASGTASAAGSASPSRLASTTAPQASSAGNPFSAGAQPQPRPSDNPFRAHGGLTTTTGQQPQPAAPAAPAAAAAAAAAAAVPPSAPPAASASASALGGGSDADDADLCVICLSAQREVGLLHGSSVHKCVCKECAGLLRIGSPCPICRGPIERLLGVF